MIDKVLNHSLIIVLSLLTHLGYTQQLSISRIDLMPDLPSPYLMRDWDEVATGYDALVFNGQGSGEHLPLVSLGEAGINYPEIARISMDSYVGWTGSHGEAINVMPAIVGASLMGIDKSTQNGVNWVAGAKDYFNLANGQNIYLNGSSSTTGGDWWYETMPNVFFYQMYDLYPDQADFSDQFKIVADQWLEATRKMGGSATPWQVPYMNYRAWNITTMEGLNQGVKEPEAAGAIAWILYHAYNELDDIKYLHGARQALDFLNEWENNPSYELQLPYGVLAAAKLNAMHGANYDLDKMLNWCFDRGDLRGWGSIVGTWDGKGISGLIGEANDGGNDYAFAMNGFQQAAALAPVVKYDKRYAKAIAKWILNLSNASRFFYSGYIAEDHQSDFSWSSTQDPNAYIAYEAIKESWTGKSLFARGDAKEAGWAATNLALYGSSHVGYLAAIVDETDTEGILDLDLNATDFLSSAELPIHLFYNPHTSSKQITVEVGAQSIDLYDAISEQVIKTAVSEEVQIDIGPNDVLLLTYIPTGSVLVEKDGKLWTGEEIVDYHYGYDFTSKFKIKALAAKNEIGEVSIENTWYATVQQTSDEVTFKWFIDGIEQLGNTSSENWIPDAIGTYKIVCEAATSTESAKDSLMIEVVEIIPEPPIIDGFELNKKWYAPEDQVTVVCMVSDPKNQTLSYEWKIDQGEIIEVDESELTFRLPENAGVFRVTCTVSNTFDLSVASDTHVFSAENAMEKMDSVIYLPLNGNVDVFGQDNYQVQASGLSYVEDAKGVSGLAVALNSSSDILTVDNEESLQFDKEITVSFWLKLNTTSNVEQFVVSHGSWQGRWKLSVTTENYLRWTINTTEGISDLDTSAPLEIDQFYHVVAVYTGNAMALYIDGELENYSAHTGTIHSTLHGIALGRHLPSESDFHLLGVIDELKVFNKALGPDAASMLPLLWADDLVITSAGENLPFDQSGTWIYPNPSKEGHFNLDLRSLSPHEEFQLNIYNALGKRMYHLQVHPEGLKKWSIRNFSQGLYFATLQSETSKLRTKLIIE